MSIPIPGSPQRQLRKAIAKEWEERVKRSNGTQAAEERARREKFLKQVEDLERRQLGHISRGTKGVRAKLEREKEASARGGVGRGDGFLHQLLPKRRRYTGS
ncbi:hypothetical protein KKI17_00110 [Patescibacteria group bacterium]|nr:hypothetical protein [Patescibacteria group bacterium]